RSGLSTTLGRDALELILLGDEVSRAVDQSHETIECARPQRDGRAVAQQSSLVKLQLEHSEAVASRWRCGCHPHSLPAVSASGWTPCIVSPQLLEQGTLTPCRPRRKRFQVSTPGEIVSSGG